VVLKEKGYDSDDKVYDSVDDMWQALAIAQDNKDAKWYGKGVEYWKDIPANYDGVLGGFEHTHEIDVVDNLRLIEKLTSLGMQKEQAIGRKIS
jgi:protein N-terminal methyltransferase